MSAPAEKSLILIIYLALAASTAIVYWQVCNFEFINYDDNQYVYENRQVLSGLTADSMAWAFKAGHAGNWHPVTWLSLMLDAQLFGPHPRWFHLVNLLFHIANTLFLFAVLRKMTAALWPSVFVAAAFALHPMHVQSVAWIAERKDVLSTFFLMLSLLAYVSFTQNRSALRYILSLAFFALGLMAKPMLVTVPFILLVLDYWPLNRFASSKQADLSETKIRQQTSIASKPVSLKQILIEKIPFLVLAAVSSIITYLVQQSSGAVVTGNALGFTARIANASVSYVVYIYKLFWPQNLTIFYPFQLGGFAFWQVALCIVLLLFISIMAIRFANKYKFLAVGWFWFIGTLFPVIGIVQIGQQAYADRYTYIPYIGLFIMIAWGFWLLVSNWRHAKMTVAILMPVVLLALGICSYWQTGYWKNNVAIFSRAVEVTDDNYLAYSSLGDEFRKKGDLTRALANYRKAVQIAPNYANAILGLGSALADKGDYDNAIMYFEETLRLKNDPEWMATAHNNIAVALRSQGKYDEAISHFQKSISLKPDSAQSRNSFAKALILNGNFDEAQKELREAVRLNPNWVEPVNILALLIAINPEIKNRNVSEAIALAKHACQLTNYNNPAVLATLAASYAAAGQFADAIVTANKAIAIADALNQPQVKKVVQHQMSFYLQGKPYVESAQKY